jgi:hypothetical protein
MCSTLKGGCYATLQPNCRSNCYANATLLYSATRITSIGLRCLRMNLGPAHTSHRCTFLSARFGGSATACRRFWPVISAGAGHQLYRTANNSVADAEVGGHARTAVGMAAAGIAEPRLPSKAARGSGTHPLGAGGERPMTQSSRPSAVPQAVQKPL